MTTPRDPDGDFLSARLRQADMDGDPTEDDLEHLIGTAVRHGRRRVLVRRVGAVLATCAVVAAIVGLGFGPLSGRSVDIGPAASPAPTTSTPTPSPTPSSTPPSTPSGEPLVARDIRAVLQDLLGERGTLADFTAAEDDNQTGATILQFSATDERGTVWITAGLGPSEEKLAYACKQPTCSIIVEGSTALYRSPDRRDPDKTGRDSFYAFVRPDGRTVQIFQRNFLGGNDPVSRPEVLLSDAEAEAFVRDSAWDAVADRCRPRGPYC